MSKTTKVIVGLIAIALSIGLIYYGWSTPEEVNDIDPIPVEGETMEDETVDNELDNPQSDDESVSESEPVEETEPPAEDSSANVVTHSDNGFMPVEVTIQAGETVRFINESGGAMWVASDMHPTHSQYSGTSQSDHCENGSSNTFDQCEPGEIYEFTFDQVGSWQYHNHLNPAAGGTVVVQ